MENSCAKCEALKCDLKTKDKDLILAASIGKNLLEENNELQRILEKNVKDYGAKFEAYEQEKYSLAMQLQSKESLIASINEELEGQEKNKILEISKVSKNFEEQISALNKKICILNETNESLENELAVNKDEIRDLKNLLEESKQHREQSFIISQDISLDESHSIQNEMQLLMNHKENLEAENLGLKTALKREQSCIIQLKKSLKNSEMEMEEMECKFTTLYNAMEKSNEEKDELRMEIDNLKMDATDPMKKGNSLFAEVEDNRQLLEKLVISLKANCLSLKEQFEFKAQQVSKLKLQIASLIDVGSTRADAEYQKYLEDSIAVTKGQLDEFAKRCKQLENEIQEMRNNDKPLCQQENSLDISRVGIGNFFKTLFEESQKKIEVLEDELTSLRFNNVSLNDKIIQLQRKHHRLEREKDSVDHELIKMRVCIDEMKIERGQKVESNALNTRKVTEKLPFISQKEVLKELENQTEEKRNINVIKDNIIDSQLLEKLKITGTEKEGSKDEIKENIPNKPKNAIKKSLRIADTIAVHELNGQVKNVVVNHSETGNKLKPVRRKMVPSQVIVANEANDTQCAQQ